MNKTVLRSSVSLYGLLLKSYPKRYRQEFGEEMKYVFSRSLKDAYVENGDQGIISVWIRTSIDACKSIISQHLENHKGGSPMKATSNDIIMQNKIFAWIALATGAILSIPLVAMQFTSEVDWKLFDFMIMGTLIFGTGFGFVQVARVIPSKYRVLTGFAFLAALFIIWVHLAVGIVDSWPLAGS